MKKRISLLGLPVLLAIVGLLVIVSTGTVLAGGPDYDKRVEVGQYELVAKDASWDILQKGQNPWGKGKFSLDSDSLTMRVIAHKLVANAWYQIEVNDKADPDGWTVVSNNDVQYYFQANEDGVADTTFTLNVSGLGEAALEINVKTAEWANTPSGWVYTPGWDYNYVLYGATTIPIP